MDTFFRVMDYLQNNLSNFELYGELSFYQTYKQSLCDDLDNYCITSQAQTKTGNKACKLKIHTKNSYIANSISGTEQINSIKKQDLK